MITTNKKSLTPVLQNFQLKNLIIELNNLDLSADTDSLVAGDEFFDFMHLIYVFQHIRPEKGIQIFTDLIDKLKENGTGMFH